MRFDLVPIDAVWSLSRLNRPQAPTNWSGSMRAKKRADPSARASIHHPTYSEAFSLVKGVLARVSNHARSDPDSMTASKTPVRPTVGRAARGVPICVKDLVRVQHHIV